MIKDISAFGDDELARWIRKSKKIQSITKIPGDASTRKYYRIISESRSYIVMRMDPFPKEGKNHPFLIVQQHLEKSKVEVPRVLDMDPEQGYILLEDLGDVTLLRRLQGVCDSNVERALFEKAVDSLVQIQIKASPTKKGKKIDAFELRFDHEKLMWEVNFAIEHFYETYLNRKLSKKDKKQMVDGFSHICQILADVPTVLAHRDFHSRNIMVVQNPVGAEGTLKDRFVIIDFQDARLGPPQYDLVSLLKDSYYQLEESQIAKLVDYYIVRYEALSKTRIDREKFNYIFDLMGVQRNFKAIGSFASFLNRRGDPTYLKFIGNTFENIRRTLLKYPEYSKLREILFHYYYF